MLLNAILPIFLLIAFGYSLKHFNITNENFWEQAEKLTYYIFFPALLISKMSNADLSNIDIWPLFYASIISLCLITIISLIAKALFNISGLRFGSVYQGAMRFNTYIGLALVDSLLGLNGLAIAVIIASMLIPSVNIFAVTVLQYYHPNKSKRSTQPSINIAWQVLETLRALIKNPLILGCIIGTSINILNLPFPHILSESTRILGSIALPLGLMAVGAAFLLNNIKSAFTLIAISASLKLIIYPCIAYWVAYWFQLDVQTKQVLTLFCALPTATASYVLAKNLNSDHQLMARIITIETLLSGLTLLITLKILQIG